MLSLEATKIINTLDEATIKDFTKNFSGQIFRPGEAGYDEARAVWNGIIDRYPALIARCTSSADVMAAVNFAREHKVEVAVRGGGHNVAGHGTSDGGLVIDLSGMKQIEVDPVSRTVRAGGGATIGELDKATQAYGLATPLGVVTETGIAGLTLSGGFGWLRNKYGLSCDNLISVDVVTADGRLIKANERVNSDLFWGVRGGGGNFGIVTNFEYRLHPVGPEVMFVFAFHQADTPEQMKAAIKFHRDFCQSAPDEISTILATGIVPHGAEVFPEEIQGRYFVLFGAMYAGDAAEGERALQPLRNFAAPLIDFSGRMPYVEAQQVFDPDYPRGHRYYWKSLNLGRLDDEVIDRFVAHARRQPSEHSTTDLWYVGGAVRRNRGGAFHGRDASWLINPEANWEHPEDDEANIAWARDFIAAMQPYSDGSRYLNFPGFQEEGDKMMRQAFGEKYDQLVALKNKYDPTNFFSLNQNIKPSA
jgi:FAD/FMN-containing dehydrogenase